MKKKLSNKLWLVILFVKKRWKLLAILLIGLVLAGGLVARLQSSNNPELVFIHPERKDLVKELEVSGVVDAKQKARLRFLAGGKVVYLGAQEGEEVRQYQTIATIDRSALQKQLSQDLNLYLKERLDWEQTLDAGKDRVLPKSEQRAKEKSQLDLTNEVLAVEIRDIAIRNTSLTAPFNGVLTVSPASTVGVTLLATDYFEIINPETLVFKAIVDEVDIGQVVIGQDAKIKLDAFEDETIETRVKYVAYTSSESSAGTVFIVELPIGALGHAGIRVGMNGDALIKVATKENALVIPLEATREQDDKVYVDVRTGEKTFEEREIVVGLETDNEVEVLAGLTEADQLLLPS